MEIKENFDLKGFNTFAVSVQAKFFAEVKTEDELTELLQQPDFKDVEKFILGGGSNILFTRDFPGIVIHNKITGIKILKENQKEVLIRVAGGENWHNLVLFAVTRGFWGIENLAYIPGSVGAAPIQNIGAYGVEIKDVFENLEAIEIRTGKRKIFSKKECEFGYRDSIFKNELKNKFFITTVTLRLSKEGRPNTEYKILKNFLEEHKIKPTTPGEISEAVTAIRKSKLPDPAVIPNAGSFFKNVFVKKSELNNLMEKYPDLPFFREEDVIKIPAAWFIEKLGWKGKRIDAVGVHAKQALVLVNYGGATGAQLKELAERITADVRHNFGVELIPEVNLI